LVKRVDYKFITYIFNDHFQGNQKITFGVVSFLPLVHCGFQSLNEWIIYPIVKGNGQMPTLTRPDIVTVDKERPIKGMRCSMVFNGLVYNDVIPRHMEVVE
jgi:hypothetical protein